MADEFPFSYQPGLTRPLDLVRFHIGDTEPDGFWLPDATINALIAQTADWHAAVIEALRFIITKLSQPNFTADWLTVDNASARTAYQTLLAEKKREFGVGSGRPTSGSTNVYRSDSRVKSEPDYSDYGAPPDELAQGRRGW